MSLVSELGNSFPVLWPGVCLELWSGVRVDVRAAEPAPSQVR